MNPQNDEFKKPREHFGIPEWFTNNQEEIVRKMQDTIDRVFESSSATVEIKPDASRKLDSNNIPSKKRMELLNEKHMRDLMDILNRLKPIEEQFQKIRKENLKPKDSLYLLPPYIKDYMRSLIIKGEKAWKVKELVESQYGEDTNILPVSVQHYGLYIRDNKAKFMEEANAMKEKKKKIANSLLDTEHQLIVKLKDEIDSGLNNNFNFVNINKLLKDIRKLMKEC